MKRIALLLLVWFLAPAANALVCADLFRPVARETGRFVSLESMTKQEQLLAQRHAPSAVAILRASTNESALVFKKLHPRSTLETLIVVNAKTGLVSHEVSGFNVENVAVSPNGEFVYVHSQGAIVVFAAGVNVILNTVPQFWSLTSMALTADGKALYTFSATEREMIILETRYLETGYSIPHFAGDGSRGSHLWPISREPGFRPVKRLTFATSEDRRYIVAAGDTGAVTVFDTKTEGRNVFPSTMLQNFSPILRDDFVLNSQPSVPQIKWTSEHSFEITIRNETEKFEFKARSN